MAVPSVQGSRGPTLVNIININNNINNIIIISLVGACRNANAGRRNVCPEETPYASFCFFLNLCNKEENLYTP